MKRKNIYYLLLTLALLLSGGGTASAQTFNRGDVNGDGVIDITDVTVLVNYLHSGQFNLVARTVSFAENTPVNKTYGDAAFTNTATPSAGASDGTLTYSSSTETVATVNATTGEVTIVGAGETIITATISAGTIYAEASASYTLTVAKATNIALTTVLPTAPTESTVDKTYTGNPIQLIQAGTMIAGAGTVKYKVTTENNQPSTDEDGWAENIPTATEAGPHYVWYYVDGNDNHNATAVCTEPITVTIAMDNSTIDNPATLMSTPPTEITGLTFSGSEIQLINAGEKKPGAGTVMYLVTDAETPAPVSTTGDWSASIPKETNAGDYYVWYYIAASNSHAKTGVCSTPITVTIAKATITDPASLMTTEPTAKMDGENNQKYTGSAINLINEGITKTGAGTVKYKATTVNTKPNTTDAGWVVGASLTETNVGKYYVWYYIDGNGNHEKTAVCESAIEVNIDKATSITDPASLMTTAPTATTGDKTFTGDPIQLINAGEKKTDAGTVMYLVTETETPAPVSTTGGWSDNIPTATDADTYYVWYYIAGNNNHDATDVCSTPIEVTIDKATSITNPASLMTTAPTATTGDKTFTGDPIQLINAGEKKTDAGTVMYLVTETETPAPVSTTGGWSDNIPTATEAGPHYVWYYVAGNNNHDATGVCSTPIEVTIDKANSITDPTSLMTTPPTANKDGENNQKYTGSAINLIIEGSTKAGAGTVMYKATTVNTKPNTTDADWVVGTSPTATNAGPYYVWYYVAGNNNHDATDVCSTPIEVTIDHATPSLTITSATELALDNTTNTGTITVDRSGDGEVTAESSDTGVATVNVDGTTITVTAVASGTATITIKMNQGTNYAAYTGTDQTVNVTVTMNLASVTSTAVGKLIGADGNVYATATAATYAGTSAIAMIVYVGEAGTADASSNTYKGLAIALTDASTSAGAAWYGTGSSYSSTCVYQNSTFSNHYGYADINGIANTNQMADKTGTCSGHTHAAATAAKNYSVAVPANCSQWFLPTSGQWLKFFRNSTLNLTWSDWGYSSGGGSDYNKVNKMFTDAGANSAVFSANAGYWSSSEFDTNHAVGVGFMSSSGILVVDLYKSDACRVRAFLAF